MQRMQDRIQTGRLQMYQAISVRPLLLHLLQRLKLLNLQKRLQLFPELLFVAYPHPSHSQWSNHHRSYYLTNQKGNGYDDGWQ